MATLVLLLALYAALAGLVAYARRDRFTGPAIVDRRPARGTHLASRSARGLRVSTQADRHEFVPAPRCVC